MVSTSSVINNDKCGWKSILDRTVEPKLWGQAENFNESSPAHGPNQINSFLRNGRKEKWVMIDVLVGYLIFVITHNYLLEIRRSIFERKKILEFKNGSFV